MDLVPFLRGQIRANRLANLRFHAALAPLSTAELHAPRTGFFPSLAATLNHILAVDLYYLAALEGDRDMARRWSEFVPCETIAALAAEQARADERFIAIGAALTAADLERVIDLDRTTHVQREQIAYVIAHLLAHQVHHRGQAHAMLAGTRIAPPQLDEFLMPSEAHLRRAEVEALGWTEATLFG
jgi:uncharacterized damage-inducible protein DinB